MSATPTRPSLDQLRRDIELIDQQVITLLERRVALARDIGRAKRAAGLPMLDPVREAAVIRRAGELARQAGLDEEAVREVFWLLMGLSRRAQSEGTT